MKECLSDIIIQIDGTEMKDWNGKDIQIARSKGGVIVVSNPLDNLISTGINPWPTPEILQKLYQSRQVRAFEGEQLELAKAGIGYYCDLQSLHSEDAITWSVFGTVSHSSEEIRKRWTDTFLSLSNLPDILSRGADIFLWRRIPHPDTLVSGGPEIDFGIITENALILGEAKWQSNVASSQGKNKNKDQIMLRGEFLLKYARRIFPKLSHHIVIGVGLSKESFRSTVPDGVLFRSVAWEAVCGLNSHPLSDEVQRYFQWKKEHTKF